MVYNVGKSGKIQSSSELVKQALAIKSKSYWANLIFN
jgi:hypothetical protein